MEQGGWAGHAGSGNAWIVIVRVYDLLAKSAASTLSDGRARMSFDCWIFWLRIRCPTRCIQFVVELGFELVSSMDSMVRDALGGSVIARLGLVLASPVFCGRLSRGVVETVDLLSRVESVWVNFHLYAVDGRSVWLARTTRVALAVIARVLSTES